MRDEYLCWFHQNPSRGLRDISVNTFAIRSAKFIMKTKEFISWATLTNKIWFWGQGIHIFTHNGEKNKENPSN